MICLKNYRAQIGVQVDSKIESFFQKHSLFVSLCPSLDPQGLSFVRDSESGENCNRFCGSSYGEIFGVL